MLSIKTIDTHTAGEPLRIILEGVPMPEGATILERRSHAKGDWDRYRRILMFEPRGHADMYGALIVPPVSPGALFGVLFMHNEGYSTGCGHATIALAKIAVELGWIAAAEPLTRIDIDAPSGLLKAYARIENGMVTAGGFENVPSFAPLLDQTVEVPGLGDVRFDLGYGGAFYAYVDADALGLTLTPDNGLTLVQAGMAIKRAVADRFPVVHPESADLSYLYGTIFTGKAQREENHSRHVCIFADGALDRSPTGTGVAGRVAILHAKGQLAIGQAIDIESIVGETFRGRVVRESQVGSHPAVVPEVEGMAYVTGRHEFVIEPGDPLASGFLIR